MKSLRTSAAAHTDGCARDSGDKRKGRSEQRQGEPDNSGSEEPAAAAAGDCDDAAAAEEQEVDE